jgi:hypothetical protein
MRLHTSLLIKNVYFPLTFVKKLLQSSSYQESVDIRIKKVKCCRLHLNFLGVSAWDTVDVMDSGNCMDCWCVILVDFVFGSNWNWDGLGIRSRNGHLNGDFFNVDFGWVLNGHLRCDFRDAASGSQNLRFLDDGLWCGSFGLGQSHEIKVGDVSTSTQIGFHDVRSVSDDDGSLGVVNPGLIGVRDNVDWGRCGISDRGSGNLDGEVILQLWLNSNLERCRSCVSDRRWSSISNWSRMGQAWCSGNDWCGNGSSKEERKCDLLGKQNSF